MSGDPCASAPITRQGFLIMPQSEEIMVVRRSPWKYALFIFFFWLIIPLGMYLFYRRSLTLTIYEDRIMLQEGIIGVDNSTMFISDIRAIEVHQTIWERFFGYGDLMIASSGTDDYEYVLMGFPDPVGLKELILDLRQEVNDNAR